MKKVKLPIAAALIALALAASAGLTYGASLIFKQPSQGSADSAPLALFTGADALSDAPESQVPEDSVGDGSVLVNEDGIVITRIDGKTCKGYMAVIDDPTRIFVGVPDYFNEELGGLTVPEMNGKYGSVLGINGGGYVDINGDGSGGTPDGLIIREGEIVWGYGAGLYDVLAFDGDGRLYVGWRTAQECLDKNVQWAVSFGPALIIDGQVQDLTGHEKNNVNPRTAVGQREDGAVVFIVLEGRQVSTLGASLDTLARLLYDAGCVNAANLDGGGSSAMEYRGRTFNICGSVFGPRNCCTAFLVAPSGEEAAK